MSNNVEYPQQPFHNKRRGNQQSNNFTTNANTIYSNTQANQANVHNTYNINNYNTVPYNQVESGGKQVIRQSWAQKKFILWSYFFFFVIPIGLCILAAKLPETYTSNNMVGYVFWTLVGISIAIAVFLGWRSKYVN